MGFTGFYRVFLGFIELYWVLPSSTVFTGFLLVNGFYEGLSRFYRVLPDFPWYC